MPGQQVLFPVLRQLGTSELVALAQRHWPEEEELKRHTLVLARRRGLGRAWRAQVGRRLRLALAVRDAEGGRKVTREILDQGRGMQFGAAAAQEVLAHAGLWQGPTQVSDQMRPHRKGAPAGIVIGCAHCGSWGITTRLCHGYTGWHRRGNHPWGRCVRCARDGLPLHAKKGLCRGCLAFVQAMRLPPTAGFTQLTFAGVLAHQLVLNGTPSRAVPVPEHGDVSARSASSFVLPGQGTLLTVPRDWRAVHAVPHDQLPALTPDAGALLDEFTVCLPATAGGQPNHAHSIQMLHRLLAYTGTDEPISERDVVELAGLGPKISLHRMVFFLHERGLLEPDRTMAASPSLARLDTDRTDARHRQAIENKLRQLPDAMADQMRTWVAVRRGQGRRPHPPADFIRIRRDLRVILPVLTAWSRDGLDLREITAAHVTSALAARQGHQARGVHHVLLSVFRALKQERAVFSNPLAGLSLTTPIRLPEPLPSDRLRGLLDRIDSAMGRLAVGLVAVHAIKVTDVGRLPLTALDLAHATLRLQLRGQPHTVHLDTLTRHLLDDYLQARHQQWPASPNPHLLVTTHSAHHPALPPVSYCALRRVFDQTGITPRQMWSDRVLDEARHTADPVHLVHLFGIHPGTAVRYVHAAHPDKALPAIR
jgi:hypothetical protein